MKKIAKIKSLRTKLLLAFSYVLGVLAIISLYSMFSIRSINQSTELIANVEVPLLVVNEEMAGNAAKRLTTIRGYLMYGDTLYLDLLDEYNEESEPLYEKIINDTDSEEAHEIVEKSKEWSRLVEEKVIGEYQKGNKEAAIKNLEDLNGLIRDVTNGSDDLASEREEIFHEITNSIMKENNRTLWVVALSSIFVFVVGIIISLVTANVIVNPIVHVMDRMKDIAAGKLNQEPLETNLVDEVGQLVKTTNSMGETVRNVLQRVQDVSLTVDTQSEELAITSNEVSQGAEQIAATMQELASGSEIEAGHASALSSQMDGFTDKIERVNDNSQLIQKSSTGVLHMAQDGSKKMENSLAQMNVIYDVVRQSVEDVEGLDQRANEISELVGVIQDIANQTNLLALNAAIEAASAGEQGRGFAVVAEEVRKLAEEVSSSVVDITGIVDGIQRESKVVVESLQSGYQEVEEGTSQLVDTGQTFTTINDSIVEVVDSIKEITNNLADVATDSQAMSGLIEEIAAISEESAAGIEETTASSEETNSAMEEITASSNDLSKLVEELNGLVQQFEL